MAVTVEPLGPRNVEALKALLGKDTTHNLYLLGIMEEFGVVCDPERFPFAFYGRFLDGELTAVLFVGVGFLGLQKPIKERVVSTLKLQPAFGMTSFGMVGSF